MVYSLIFGLVTLGFGLIPKIVRPKKINSWYGYRTPMSMMNQETWDEGNRYSSTQYIIAGIILLIIGRVAYAFIATKPYLVPLIAFVPVLTVTVFTTEKHMKKIFDIDGMRISGNGKLKQKGI
ncbi:SdpI family protein [Clostridium sp. P21]|uniref:SdpI family protein n=1 Tax=Clostridium muellerianum TaxID=2716538 RepID=A0A7Y0HQF9_9CLOT|nr:SdpI family protein [Clostridium muellerianum]NMM64697.1 SdpI family protein [Clostridium muellerianum]